MLRCLLPLVFFFFFLALLSMLQLLCPTPWPFVRPSSSSRPALSSPPFPPPPASSLPLLPLSVDTSSSVFASPSLGDPSSCSPPPPFIISTDPRVSFGRRESSLPLSVAQARHTPACASYHPSISRRRACPPARAPRGLADTNRRGNDEEVKRKRSRSDDTKEGGEA